MRCKFKCITMRKVQQFPDTTLYEFNFLSVRDDTTENATFYAETPDGSISLLSVDESRFVPGTEYYLDFTQAGGA